MFLIEFEDGFQVLDSVVEEGLSVLGGEAGGRTLKEVVHFGGGVRLVLLLECTQEVLIQVGLRLLFLW